MRATSCTLVGVAERGAPELLAELARLGVLRQGEVILAHIVDTGARGEVDLPRGRLVHRPLPPHRARVMGAAERHAAAAALAEATAAAKALGAVVASTQLADGEPGRALSALAVEHGCSLVAVASRMEGWHGERPGPHSVGRTARFVVDHSPCPVLLVRGHGA
ncbi:MAG: universal stress protein [Candidatus Dormibacteraeota bacterium]|nr:universal stress protein [Candidatus Dormibacteraeota bacterium]